MEFPKELTLEEMMQFAHNLEGIVEGLNMFNGSPGDSEIRTIKKK
jgi:hypothetical protein